METETAEDGRPPPTFRGRLKLESFMFNAGATPNNVRRSPRISAAPSTTTVSPEPSPTPSSSRSPSKRKALTGPEDDNTITTSLPTPLKLTTTTPTGTPTRKRARPPPSTYAPPSTYSHLSPLPDILAPNLLILFIGLNPGISTARTGHAYAHPTNLFWRLLHTSGITTRLVPPTQDGDMPAEYALGFTNIVSRPSRNGAELSKTEMDAGVAVLEQKVALWRPEVVCVVGKSIWESVWRVRKGRGLGKGEFRYGWQGEGENMGVGVGMTGGGEGDGEEGVVEGVDYSAEWKGARVFVASSTSGLAATLKPKEKEEIWRELGEWVVQRRAERVAAAVAAGVTASGTAAEAD